MSNSKISMAEAISLVLVVFVAHCFVSLPRNLLVSSRSSVLINLIFVFIIVSLFTYIVFRLIKRFDSSDIIDISEYLGGKIFKNIIGFIFIFYLTFSSSILLRSFSECLKVVFFPMTNISFIIISFIITIILSNKYKFSSISRVSLLVFPSILITILFTFIANSHNFNINNIFPILGEGIINTFIFGLGNLGAFGGLCVLYFLPPVLKKPEDLKKISMYSIGLSCLYLFLCVAIILFMFPFLQEVDTLMPLYYAAKYIELGEFFQRLETIFLFTWIMSVVCYLNICVRICLTIFKKITNIKEENSMNLVFSMLILIISLLPNNYAVLNYLESNIYKYLVIFINFILGSSILILAYIKKKKVGIKIE